MVNNKINLVITVPGAVMMSEREAAQKGLKNGGYTQNRLCVTNHKGKKEFIEFQTRNNRTATQVMNLCDEAYNYFISNDCPEWANAKEWQKMPKKTRLWNHLKRISDSFNGISFSYTVLED